MNMNATIVIPDKEMEQINDLLNLTGEEIYQKYGYKWGESQVEMESNENVQSQWGPLKPENHKRRRCYMKRLKD